MSDEVSGGTGETDGRRVGIKEVAQALGMSIGTVDRALHNRRGISPLTRQRVLRMAENLGYRPNLAARSLRFGKTLTFAIILPQEIAYFFDAVREGVRRAATSYDGLIRIEHRTPRRLGEGDAELFEAALAGGVNGVIVAPGTPARMKSLIRRAARQNVPVVCVSTDAPGTERLACVSADAYTSGAVVGELFHRFRVPEGPLAVITGSLDTVDHAEKVRGFRETLSRLGRPTGDIEVVEAHDDEGEAWTLTHALLARRPEVQAIYASTANSLPVLHAVEEAGRMDGLTMVTTDVFPELVPLLRAGKVAATMYQRPISQGRLAFQALYRFVMEGSCPSPKIGLMPHVVMSSNLDLVLRDSRDRPQG